MFRSLIAVAAMTLAVSTPLSALPLPKTSPPAEVDIDASVHVPDAPTKIGPYAFHVYLEMSSAALSLLTKKKEQVVVFVSYFGEPTKAGKRFAEPTSGMIETANEFVTVSATTKQVTVRGSKVTAVDVKRIVDEAVQVNVNVSTARLSGPDNLINCRNPTKTRSLTHRKSGVYLNCKLIAE